MEEESDEDYDPNFPDDIPEGFKGAAFGAMLAMALSQHGFEESDSEDEEEEEEAMQLRHKKPDFMKGIMQHTMLLGKPTLVKPR